MTVSLRTHRARQLRKNMTDAERHLWRALREAALPYKVRRQHPIGRYIADFAVPARKLVIEVDGGQHADAAQADAKRSCMLAAHGYRVIRFLEQRSVGQSGGVLYAVISELEMSPTSP